MANEQEVERLATELRDELIAEGVPQETVTSAVSEFIDNALEVGRDGTMQFVNEGIARGLGAPVDLVNMAPMAANFIPGVEGVGPMSDKPLGGSESIRSAMRGLENVTDTRILARSEPEGFVEQAAVGTGEAVGALVPVLGAASKVAQSGNAASKFVAPIADTAVRKPISTFGLEMSAGAGSGLGRELGMQQSETGAAPIIGELIGGIAGGLAPSMLPANLAVRTAKNVTANLLPFSKVGARPRAERRIAELATDPKGAAAQINTDDTPLTPSQQTGDPALMALEREAAKSGGPRDEVALDAQIDAAKDVLRQQLRGEAPTEGFVEFMQGRINQALQSIEARVNNAEKVAEDAASNILPKRRRSESARIARDEVEAAFEDGREAEAALWGMIPEEITVPTVSSKTLMNDIVQATPTAQQSDIPKLARDLLTKGFSSQESVAEMIGLYKRLGDINREAKARPSGGRNTVRIVNQLREALLDDIARAPQETGAHEAVHAAIDYSRRLNAMFTQGSVGTARSSVRAGGDRVSPEETLATTTGRGGEAGARSTREVLSATEGVDGGSLGTPAARDAVQDFLKSRFMQAASKDGKISPAAAEAFIKANSETLDLFPTLRQDMERAATSRTAAARIRKTGEAREKSVQRTKTDFDIKKIVSGRHKEAARTVRSAARDKSGAAMDDIKGAFLGHLAEQGSAKSMADIMAAPGAKVIMSRFKPHERERVKRIVSDLGKLDAASGSLPDVGRVVNDLPNTLLMYIGRVLGARAGARAGAGSSGASLVTANLASQRVRKFLESITTSGTEKLLREAIQGDRELYRSLLLDVTVPANAKKVNQRLNAWLATIEGEEEQ